MLSHPPDIVATMSRRTTHIGYPGASPRRLARTRRWRARLVATAGVLAASLLLVAGLPLAGLGVLLAALASRSVLAGRAERAAAGANAERRVAEHLGRLRADVIIHNARSPGFSGDVDIVVLGPMAAAVEVKLGAGKVRLAADGQVRVAGRLLPGRPLRQAVAMAAATRRTTGLAAPVAAVLCVSEMRQRPRLVDVDGVAVWVTSARHLRRVLLRLPHHLDRAEAHVAASIYE